jgi:hypothetical protein
MSSRADACAVLFACVFPLLAVLAYFVLLKPFAPWLQQTVYVLAKTLQFAFPAVWAFAVEARLHAVTGTGRGRRSAAPSVAGGESRWGGLAGLAAGLAFGLLVAGGMLVLYHAWLGPAGYLDVAREPLGERLSTFAIDSLPRYVLFGVFISLVHSFLEEYYWRWFVFDRLRRLVPTGAAIALSSGAFMLHHVVLLGVYFHWALLPTGLFSLAVAVGGAAWAWLYHRTGSLVSPWLSHLLVDAAIFAVGYQLVAGYFGS